MREIPKPTDSNLSEGPVPMTNTKMFLEAMKRPKDHNDFWPWVGVSLVLAVLAIVAPKFFH